VRFVLEQLSPAEQAMKDAKAELDNILSVMRDSDLVHHFGSEKVNLKDTLNQYN
jgi:hypothetical protein